MNRYTINTSTRDKIASFIRDRYFPSGLGDMEMACSIASINLALSGKLTDTVPDCMSVEIGRWIIETQDEMSDELRNSEEWKFLLPFAAGTGRKHEDARHEMLREWYSAKYSYDCEGQCGGDDDGDCCCSVTDQCDPVGMLRRLIEVSHIIPEPNAKERKLGCVNCLAAV